jgi:hypothetical protein
MTKSKKTAKKAVKKANKVKRIRFYGLVKPKKGAKFAWISVQNKNGWSLGFATNDRTIWLRNLRFTSIEEVQRVVGVEKIVFVHLKESK